MGGVLKCLNYRSASCIIFDCVNRTLNATLIFAKYVDAFLENKIKNEAGYINIVLD